MTYMSYICNKQIIALLHNFRCAIFFAISHSIRDAIRIYYPAILRRRYTTNLFDKVVIYSTTRCCADVAFTIRTIFWCEVVSV